MIFDDIDGTLKEYGPQIRERAERDPAFKRFWSRKLDLPSGYINEKAWRLYLWTALTTGDIWNAGMGGDDLKKLMEGAWPQHVLAQMAARHDHQVYRVTPELCKCLAATKGFPQEWCIDQIRPPYDAIHFFLPDGAMRLPDGNSIQCIMAGVASFEDLYENHISVGCKDPTFLVYGFGTSTNVAYHCKLRIVDGKLEYKVAEEDYTDHTQPDEIQEMWDIKEDHELSLQVIKAALTLLCMINQPKRYVESSAPVRTIKMRPPVIDEKRTSLVKPHILGAGMVAPKVVRYYPSSDGEPKWKMAPHWRAAHLHTVRYGKGKALSKNVWYPPTRINSDQED